MSDQITTWIDENDNLYWQSSIEGGVDVFDVQEALNKELDDNGEYRGLTLGAMDVLEFSKYIYVMPEALEKEVWEAGEVFESPHLSEDPLVPVGVIDLNVVAEAYTNNRPID